MRDPPTQVAEMGVPEEHLLGHAFHTYRLVSPDETVAFEFQHNVCGRSIYAEGTVDAAQFLAKKVQEGDADAGENRLRHDRRTQGGRHGDQLSEERRGGGAWVRERVGQ